MEGRRTEVVAERGKNQRGEEGSKEQAIRRKEGYIYRRVEEQRKESREGVQ